MELLNKLNSSIDNYFIDNDIIIKEDDNIKNKYKKYLLKYRKFIALICLIILLIIGYYYNPFNIENKNIINNNKSIQKGGSEPTVPSVETPASETPASETPASETPAEPAKDSGKKSSKIDKGVAQLSIKVDKIKEAKDKAKESLKKSAKKLVSPSAYYDAGAAVAHKFKDNAGVIYQIIYSVALFIVLCVITVPAMAFAIIGIMCFFLLKDKMKTIKGL
jgi:hypothetical protein